MFVTIQNCHIRRWIPASSLARYFSKPQLQSDAMYIHIQYIYIYSTLSVQFTAHYIPNVIYPHHHHHHHHHHQSSTPLPTSSKERWFSIPVAPPWLSRGEPDKAAAERPRSLETTVEFGMVSQPADVHWKPHIFCWFLGDPGYDITLGGAFNPIETY